MNIFPKLLSGRLFLTWAAGIAFLYCCYIGLLSEGAIAAIILSVFKDYFQRTDRAQPKSPVINPPAS